MASIFDYYGDMYKGMEDRAAEKEAVLNARKDAMFSYLEKFPYMEDETIDAFAKEQGVSATTVTAIKNQRNRNIEDRDLEIEKKELENESNTLTNNLFKDTYNDKIELSDQSVIQGRQQIEGTEYDNIFKKETLKNNIRLSEIEVEDKEIELEIKKATKDDIIDLSKLEVESKIALLNSTKLDNEKKRLLLPYVKEEIEQKLRKGELDIDRLQQIMDQDDQLFPGKLKLQMQDIIAGDLSNEEKRIKIAELIKENKRQEIRFIYEEQGLKTEQIDQMYTVMDKIMETFPDMTPDEAREVALILGFQGTNLDTIVSELDKIKKQNDQVKLEKDIGFNANINASIQTRFDQILEKNISKFGDNYTKKDIIEAVFLEMTAGIEDQTQLKLIKDMIETYANSVGDEYIQQLQTNTWVSTLNSDVIQNHISRYGTKNLEQLLRDNGVPDSAVKDLIERTEFTMMESLIEKMMNDRAYAEVFLTGDVDQVEKLLNAYGLYFPGGTLERLEWIDDVKVRIQNHQKFKLINSDIFTTAVDEEIKNYQDTNNKTINVLKESNEIDEQVALALQLINTQYVLGLQEMEIVTEQVKQLYDNNNVNGQRLFGIWLDSHSSSFKTVDRFENDAKNNISGNGIKFNSAENSHKNEGFISVESGLETIEHSINNQLSEILVYGETTIDDLDKMVVDFNETLTQIETKIFNSTKTLMIERAGGGDPIDSDVRNHEEYKKEMQILNKYKQTILESIASKKSEMQEQIKNSDNIMNQEGKIDYPSSATKQFTDLDQIKKFAKENNLPDITYEIVLQKFNISNRLKKQINNRIKLKQANKDDKI
jgi:hypothetical protein